MNIYQKAIKARKVCENKESCYICDYQLSCFSSNIVINTLADESISSIVKAIKKEKWNVK